MIKFSIFALFYLFSVPFVINENIGESDENSFRITCYLGSWSNYREGDGKFEIEDIDPFLCTHVIYAFASLENNNIVSFDPHLDLEQQYSLRGYQRFNNLKQQNPKLKTIIAIGGWNDGTTKYRKMVEKEENRQIFVESVIQFLLKYNFSGLDFDWEFPATQIENFLKLVTNLRDAFKPYNFALTSSVSAGKSTKASFEYSVPEMTKLVDFVTLKAYDFHGPWESYTGHNAPIYSNSTNTDDNILTIDYSINYWISKGADLKKIVMGIPLYGRSYTLSNSINYSVKSSASGPGNKGIFTKDEGFIGYNEICLLQKNESDGWGVYFDNISLTPYMVSGNQWISYDDINSIEYKANYIIKKGLGGAMIWSIDMDDFRGVCGQQKFPLINKIKASFEKVAPQLQQQTSTSTIVSTTNAQPKQPQEPTSRTSTVVPPPIQELTSSSTVVDIINKPKSDTFSCERSGFFPVDGICTEYYECVESLIYHNSYFKYHRQCPAGTLFSGKLSSCQLPINVDDCKF